MVRDSGYPLVSEEDPHPKRRTGVLAKEVGEPRDGFSEPKKKHSHPGKMPARGSVGKEPNGSFKTENLRLLVLNWREKLNLGEKLL